jgi:hypothetical protein
MKSFIKIVLSATMLLALVGCSTSERPVASVLPSAKPVITIYEREQTKGDVRVVLLKVEHSTFFISQNNVLASQVIQNAEPGKFYPLPAIGITYLVEALGSEPITNRNTYGDSFEEISISGHKASDNALPENIIPGSMSSFIPGQSSLPNLGLNYCEELPKSFNKERSWVEETYVRAESSQTGMMRLQLKAGFNDHPEIFTFDNIPMN